MTHTAPAKAIAKEANLHYELPQFILDNQSCTQLLINPRTRCQRTPLESGIVQQSPVTRHPWVEYRLTYQLSQATYHRFWRWWCHDVAQGSVPFVWKNPQTRKTQTAQIVEGHFTAQPVEATLNTWQVQLTLESNHHD